jgi:hypothetical protein
MKLKEKLAEEYIRKNSEDLAQPVPPELSHLAERFWNIAYWASKTSYKAGFEKAREMAANKALNYGYTIDFEPKYQPWAREANLWLRAQNKEIQKQVESLGEEVVKE